MKIKTSDLEGAALDWAVAKCEESVLLQPQLGLMRHCLGYNTFNPSTNWSQGGPIIEREKVCAVDWDINTGLFTAENFKPHANFASEKGPTQLIAAMRCYVTSKLGEEVEIPDELL